MQPIGRSDTKQLTSCTQDMAYRSQDIEVELSKLLEAVLGSSQRW